MKLKVTQKPGMEKPLICNAETGEELEGVRAFRFAWFEGGHSTAWLELADMEADIEHSASPERRRISSR